MAGDDDFLRDSLFDDGDDDAFGGFGDLDDLDDMSGMGGLDDYSSLDDEPASFLDDDFVMEGFDDGDEGGGISRNFKIAGGILLLSVIAIIIILIAFTVSRSGQVTDTDRTRTAVPLTNTAVQVAFGNTVTAVFLEAQATQDAILTREAQATATENAFQTQQAVDATETAVAATEAFHASQTAEAMLELTAQAEAAATATAEVGLRLDGQVLDEDENPVANVGVRLYRDDEDGEFNPASSAPALPEGDSGGAEPGVPLTPTVGVAPDNEPDVNTIAYGETVQGTLDVGAEDLWTFSGAAGDAVFADAVADDSLQTDMFLELLGPTGTVLTSDDDGGGDFNASIAGFTLPADGDFVLRVSSVTGPGGYSLSLDNTPPADDATSAISPARASSRGEIVLVRQGGEATPTPEELPSEEETPTSEPSGTPEPTATTQAQPQPGGGDELIGTLETDDEGNFDFGVLEPGTYWLELDYNSLPPDLQALVEPGESLVIQVIMPDQGEPVLIPITGEGVEPGPSSIDLTNTALALTVEAGGILTPTPTSEPGMETPGTPGEMTPGDMTPGEIGKFGFYEDVSDTVGGLEGSNGLAILAIAAVGLVAVVFIARKLRTSG